jgi:hypothetical protein
MFFWSVQRNYLFLSLSRLFGAIQTCTCPGVALIGRCSPTLAYSPAETILAVATGIFYVAHCLVVVAMSQQVDHRPNPLASDVLVPRFDEGITTPLSNRPRCRPPGVRFASAKQRPTSSGRDPADTTAHGREAGTVVIGTTLCDYRTKTRNTGPSGGGLSMRRGLLAL